MEEALSWRDVLGHEGNIHRLRIMLRDGRLPHALLFSGISGVGKKKVAHLLAAALLCGRKDAPCGVCPSCRAFLAGTHSDYVETAPESRGKGVRVLRIDAVREIEKKVARKPLLSGCFVVLVDDVDAMNEAAALLLGTHDFSAFRAAGGAPMLPVRTMYSAEGRRIEGERIEFRFHANGFLYHMARNIVGTLVDVGRGRRTRADFAGILASRERKRASATAPACGLFLESVVY